MNTRAVLLTPESESTICRNAWAAMVCVGALPLRLLVRVPATLEESHELPRALISRSSFCAAWLFKAPSRLVVGRLDGEDPVRVCGCLLDVDVEDAELTKVAHQELITTLRSRNRRQEHPRVRRASSKLDKTYGHLLPDALDRTRQAFDGVVATVAEAAAR